jgi:hypothetical protein
MPPPLFKSSLKKGSRKALQKITKQRKSDFLTEGNEDNEGFLGWVEQNLCLLCCLL